jgi:broad specificity phosphatase PhoE
MNQSLILLRHSQRQGASDQLTQHGLEQSKNRGNFFFQLYGSEVTLLSSPKSRCLQSLERICTLSQKAPRVIEELSERFPVEDAQDFKKRVDQSLYRILSHQSEFPIILCSHSDWLSVAATHLLDLDISFLEGSWVRLSKEAAGWTLKELIFSDVEFELLKKGLPS